ncbi:MAG: hypothetical protein LBU32_12410 [Clostridiales bacterium]|jgi:hypothetical protein|nr:hypothetical protein [Clostridiales bacterium]
MEAAELLFQAESDCCWQNSPAVTLKLEFCHWNALFGNNMIGRLISYSRIVASAGSDRRSAEEWWRGKMSLTKAMGMPAGKRRLNLFSAGIRVRAQ